MIAKLKNMIRWKQYDSVLEKIKFDGNEWDKMYIVAASENIKAKSGVVGVAVFTLAIDMVNAIVLPEAYNFIVKVGVYFIACIFVSVFLNRIADTSMIMGIISKLKEDKSNRHEAKRRRSIH